MFSKEMRDIEMNLLSITFKLGKSDILLPHPGSNRSRLPVFARRGDIRHPDVDLNSCQRQLGVK